MTYKWHCLTCNKRGIITCGLRDDIGDGAIAAHRNANWKCKNLYIVMDITSTK